ncbi:hypothetical protein ACH5RR_008891 [Cinchona calisaya]|uniref:Uncharacterized protein n=1 Tax=Cinchona calisaya TaxID=153742 RepID=A0ABD3AD14_9GENT
MNIYCILPFNYVLHLWDAYYIPDSIGVHIPIEDKRVHNPLESFIFSRIDTSVEEERTKEDNKEDDAVPLQALPLTLAPCSAPVLSSGQLTIKKESFPFFISANQKENWWYINY